MATRNAIRPRTSPHFSYDADPATFTAAHFYLDGTAAQASFFPVDDASSGCSVSPDVPAPRPRSDRETNGLCVLGQNYPNPVVGKTTVPFTLAIAADVQFSLFDAAGRKVTGVIRKGLKPGEHLLSLNLSGLGLPPGEYTYHLQVTSRYGVFSKRQTMTAK